MNRLLPAFLLLPALVISGEPQKRVVKDQSTPLSAIVAKQKQSLVLTPVPSDSLPMALSDARSVGVSDLAFVRWIFIPSGKVEDHQAIADTLNKISRSQNLRKPIRVSPYLLRFDIRWYAPSVQDTQEWLSLWESLQFDPWFSLLITQDTINQLAREVRDSLIVTVPWRVPNGNGTTYREFRKFKLSERTNITVVRSNGTHLAGSGIEELQRLTISQAPVVHYSYFLARVLSTLRDREGKEEGVFSTIWGGLYYDFAGIKRAKQGSDLDKLIADLGVSDGKQSFQKLFDDKLRSDERVAVFRSGVTGKPRRVIWFGTPASRLSVASGVVFITEDIRDKDVDVGRHAIMNLVEFKVAAYEVIWTRPNGMQGYAIFDAEGKLLDEAAADVVVDHLVPAPHTNRLQGAISCIRCHGPNDGWQPLQNDVKVMLSDYIDVFGDTTDMKKTIPDTLDRLVGWYNGNPQKPLMRAKDDYAEAVGRATGPWKASKSQTDVVRLSSQRISEIYRYDRYDPVTSRIAVAELGFSVDSKTLPVLRLRELLPPDARAKTLGIIPEDGRIAGLLKGREINRSDYSLVLNFMLERSEPARRKYRASLQNGR